MCFSREDVTLTDSLLRPLSMEDLDNSLWSDKCDYIMTDECDNLNTLNYNFIVM